MAASNSKISDAKAVVTGAVNVAPIGTPLPISASAALDAAFETFYSSADGATIKIGHDTTALDAWEAADIKILDNKTNIELTINPLECFGLNEAIAGLMFGAANVTTDSSDNITGISIKDGLPAECIVVIDTLLENGSKQRFIIPRYQCMTQGDIVLKRGASEQPNITGKCLPNATGVKIDVKYATA